jgi:hypothetical protein
MNIYMRGRETKCLSLVYPNEDDLVPLLLLLLYLNKLSIIIDIFILEKKTYLIKFEFLCIYFEFIAFRFVLEIKLQIS